MSEQVLQGLGVLVRMLEIIGAGALALGFLVATVRCFLAMRRLGKVAAVERYRQALGRAVLIGLEILVAATIIKTITLEPTVESMSFLAITVAIRTALGWTTVLEISGRWPWQRPRPAAVNSETPS